MADYINKIGNLTVAEMPKAPTNFNVEGIYEEGNTNFNLTWTLNMTSTQFPDDAQGMWMQCIQQWNYSLKVWEDKEKIWNLTETSKMIMFVNPMDAYKRFRVITGKLDIVNGSYDIWLEIYPSQPAIAYCNNIIPQAIYDVANCNYCNFNGYENGWKWVGVSQNPQPPLNPWDTGWYEAWFSCINPNTGLYYGMMKIKQVYGENDMYQILIGESTTQASEIEVGFNGVNYHFNASGIETIRIDSINDDKTAIGTKATINVPAAKHFTVPTDLNITYKDSRHATATWVNHAGDDENENYISYIADATDDNIKWCDNIYAPNNSAVIGDYSGNNFANGQTYSLVVVTQKSGTYLKSQPFSYTHSA